MLISEMTLYYKKKGLSLAEGLNALYEKFGFFKEELVSIELKGKEGQEKIASCIDSLRNAAITEIGNVKVRTKLDYKLSTEENLIENTKTNIELPKSNVLKFILENGSSFVVRPSGTEPKMKVYLAVKGSSLDGAINDMKVFKENVMELIESKLN